jgi:hypothetical protein
MTGYAQGNLRGIQGAGNEQLVAARALKHGFIVFFKLWSDTKYDMIIDCEGRLFRAQVKGSAGGTFGLSTVQRGGVQQPNRRPIHQYTRDDCDLIIGVDARTGECYVVPIDYAMAYGRPNLARADAQPFKERWDFIAGNAYLNVDECLKGMSIAELRNRVAAVMGSPAAPGLTHDQLKRVFYENCPRGPLRTPSPILASSGQP